MDSSAYFLNAHFFKYAFSSTHLNAAFPSEDIQLASVLPARACHQQQIAFPVQARCNDLADENRMVARGNRTRNLALHVAQRILENRTTRFRAFVDFQVSELVTDAPLGLEKVLGYLLLPLVQERECERLTVLNHRVGARVFIYTGHDEGRLKRSLRYPTRRETVCFLAVPHAAYVQAVGNLQKERFFCLFVQQTFLLGANSSLVKTAIRNGTKINEPAPSLVRSPPQAGKARKIVG